MLAKWANTMAADALVAVVLTMQDKHASVFHDEEC